jgi:WD40 repeat protein
VDVPVERKYEVSIDKKTFMLRDPKTGNFRTVSVGGNIYHHIKCVSLSPDGKHALTAEADEHTIKLWHISSGICRFVFAGHEFHINSVCFSPDGKQAVSGSLDTTVKLWDVRKGLEYCLNTFEGHGCSVTSVCFSPNGKLILSGDKKGTVKLWDIASATCIRTFEEHSTEIKSVFFSSSGDKIVSASSNETIVWDLEYEMCFPGWQDWDKGARPYLDIFLTLYPKWTIKDFSSILLPDLRNRGYGWLKPEGIKAMLEVLSEQENT